MTDINQIYSNASLYDQEFAERKDYIDYYKNITSNINWYNS